MTATGSRARLADQWRRRVGGRASGWTDGAKVAERRVAAPDLDTGARRAVDCTDIPGVSRNLARDGPWRTKMHLTPRKGAIGAIVALLILAACPANNAGTSPSAPAAPQSTDAHPV